MQYCMFVDYTNTFKHNICISVNFRKRFDFMTYTLRYTVISVIKSENGNLMGGLFLDNRFLFTTDYIVRKEGSTYL